METGCIAHNVASVKRSVIFLLKH